MSMIEVKDLHFTYPAGVEALRGVNLTIEPDTAVAIVGQNGSGKTTLVKHFNALLHQSSGTVSVFGESTANREPADLAAKVGFVFQNPDDQVFTDSVWKELSFGPRNLGLSEKEIEERANAALAVVGLIKFKDIHPYDLTITERKLVCLASILAMDPDVIILDEPTTAQDQWGVIRLAEIIRELRSRKKAVITITHDMNFVGQSFERTVVMRYGEVILDGETGDVFSHPQELMTTYVRPPSMMMLAQSLGVLTHTLTIDQFVSYVREHRKV